MRTLEQIDKQLAKVAEAEERLYAERQSLYHERDEAEKREKETKFEGKPQIFLINFGYGGYYYVAARTKEEAVNTFLSDIDSKFSESEARHNIEAIGKRVLFEPCDSTR